MVNRKINIEIIIISTILFFTSCEEVKVNDSIVDRVVVDSLSGISVHERLNSKGIVIDSVSTLGGKKNGLIKLTIDEEDIIVYSNYKNDSLHGEHHVMSKDGVMLHEGFYEDGQKAGEWLYWRKDGTLFNYEYYTINGELYYKKNYKKNLSIENDGFLFHVLIVNDTIVDGEIKYQINAVSPPNTKKRLAFMEKKIGEDLYISNYYGIDDLKGLESTMISSPLIQKGNVTIRFMYMVKDTINDTKEFYSIDRNVFVK